MNLAGIGLSLVDFIPNELAYFSMHDIDFCNQTIFTSVNNVSTTLTDMQLTIKNIQIDAMQNEVFPVLFGPKDPFRNIER